MIKNKKTIDKILANRELEDVFIFKSNNEIIKLPIKFINYFEVKNRIIYINSCSKIYNNKSFYQKLDNIEKELNNKGFVRCHRSFLINIENIIDISSTEVTFLII
ncbi:hypothetical protein CYK83_15730 [Clostridium perfringens]|nr:hypothetical protein CYK83_15730 [Clostridium perfringens]